jgi:hypothetical protein
MSGSATVFTMHRGRLISWDLISGDLRWDGRPLGVAVRIVRSVPGEARAIVMLDRATARSPGPCGRGNLASVDGDGRVRWVADLPTDGVPDRYLSFDLDGDEIAAQSWSGYRVRLDLATGEIVDKIVVARPLPV